MPYSSDYYEHVNVRNCGWQARRKLAFALSFDRDCVFPMLKATQADHLHYTNLRSEVPLRDIVPLHPFTHGVVTMLRKIGPLKHLVNAFLMISYMACIALAAPLRMIHLVLLALGARRAGRYFATFIAPLFMTGALLGAIVAVIRVVSRFHVHFT